MSDRSHSGAPPADTTSSSALAVALACGLLLGAVAKYLGTLGRSLGPAGLPLVMLGMGTAVWVTAGFLIARRCAKGRSLLDGIVWAGAAMAVYLSAWLLSYSFVFGLQQDGGFAAAWLNERIYFALAPIAAAGLGFVAAASWRTGWLADACLIAPIAWSVPEVVLAFSIGWQFVLAVGVPALALAGVPVVTTRRRINKVHALVGLVSIGLVAYGVLRFAGGGKF